MSSVSCCASQVSFSRLEDFKSLAKKRLPSDVWEYYSFPSCNGFTIQENERAFQRYRLLPRVLRDVSRVDTTATVLGSQLDMPVAIAPTAHHSLAHPDGEKATATGAASANSAFVLSSFANCSMEDIAQTAPHGVRWFYLILQNDPDRTRELLQRAERAGFTAIWLTVDQPRFQFQHRPESEMKSAEGVRLPNLTFDDAPGDARSPEFTAYLRDNVKQPITWDDVVWLRKNTSLKIVLKGILSAEDAKEAVKVGVDGICVSNHGGRQLDGVPASIDALPDIVRAVGGKVEVYVDGGVRTGTDVLKALALGARCVFIGRPVLWGLAANGAEGVHQVLQLFKEQLNLAMAQAGCSQLSDIKPSLVIHESYYLHGRHWNTGTLND
ncbi:PREDICTED: hydroxyacid oxidase 2-like [Branchiostoma belcheri]|uniref:(S)-2-hydroxy-acid oxidase n=1 Tax=Branchiostoma belcheri TaxID=7741 RepID=A0A6P4ZJT6_BRABE|nr:PREDICTED: hydroxyacid oxidase 2-like [Branchiostoma belcheri]